MALTVNSLGNAIRKAQRLQPAVYRLKGDGLRIVASSNPGQAYSVRVSEGKVSCECQGFERVGVCYHAAAVAISEGLLDPDGFLEAVAAPQPEPQQPERPAHETAVLRTPAGRGRLALYG
jgi:hypothetical protein